MEFQLQNSRAPLKIDFYEGEVQLVQINGAVVANTKSKYQIELPASFLFEGHNRVSINYRQKYSNSGQGD